VGGSQGGPGRQASSQSGSIQGPASSSSAGDSDDSNIALEAGKYISDSIYIGVEQGINQESTAVRVEVELFPRVTLEGRTSPSSSRVGAGWKMDY